MTPTSGTPTPVDRDEIPAQHGRPTRALYGPFRTLGVVGSVAVAVSSGAQPTGIDWYDFLLLTAMAAVVAQVARSAPTVIWATAAAAGVLTTGSAGIAGQLLLSGATVVAWRGSGPFRERPASEFNELVVAAASVGATASLLRLQDVFVAYSSAGIVAVALAVSLVAALPRSTVRARRVLTVGPAVLTIAALVITCGAWLSVRSLRDNVNTAAAAARQSVQELRAGNTESALGDLDTARAELGDIDEALRGPWPTLALGVPLVSQNLQAARTTTESADRLVSVSQSLSESATIGSLLDDGSFNLARLGEIDEAIAEVEYELVRSSAELADTDGPWIAPPLQSEVAAFTDDLERATDALGMVDRLAEVMPNLLGADGERTYLVLVTNPSEARELGGFAGGYAVVRATEGELRVIQSGRAATLNTSPTTRDALASDYPARFLEHQPWRFAQNFTAMKDLPLLTQAISELFPSMAGHPIDGVLTMDPFALEALVALTGPVPTDSSDLTLTKDNTAAFFHTDQYLDVPDQADREAIFDQLITSFFVRLNGEVSLDGSNIDRLIEVVRQDRLGFATLDPDELAALDEIGVAESFGRSGDAVGDFLSVSHLNAAPNKLDAYLTRIIDYDVVVDPSTGMVEAELAVTLRNDAPEGLSDYVASNRSDLDFATNRALLVVHTPLELTSTTESPEPVFTRTLAEFGVLRHEQIVHVPRGEQRTVVLHLQGTLPLGTHPYSLEVDHHPLVHPDSFTVTVQRPGETNPILDESITLSQDHVFGETRRSEQTNEVSN